MQTFSELLQSSALVQGVLAVMVVGAIIFQVARGQQPSETLVAIGGTIVGYYFGTKAQQAITASHKEIATALIAANMPKESD
jgi:positive regulator of sigma E activity